MGNSMKATPAIVKGLAEFFDWGHISIVVGDVLRFTVRRHRPTNGQDSVGGVAVESDTHAGRRNSADEERVLSTQGQTDGLPRQETSTPLGFSSPTIKQLPSLFEMQRDFANDVFFAKAPNT